MPYVRLAAALALTLTASATQITPAPNGPFHTDGPKLLDSRNQPFLMRGTQLPIFHPQTVPTDTRAALDYGPHSSTSLAAIRLRFNMNTVLLPVDPQDAARPDFLPELSRLVHRINDLEMLAVIVAESPTFWRRTAAAFKDTPNVMFSVGSDASAQAIRATGARHTIIASVPIDDPNSIREYTPRLTDVNTTATQAIATGWDLDLDNAEACAQLPSDPGDLTALIQRDLAYFDAHSIHWTASLFQPGRLIKDLADHDATSLENGWTCGQAAYPAAGIGRVLQAHLRDAEERGLFVVSAAGGVDLPRGGYAIAYGPVMAARDAHADLKRPALHAGGVTVNITDAHGATRPGGIFYASAGWGQINFVIPAESATGPARMTVVRDDGSRTYANILIADTAPGFWTGISCRGPALGTMIATTGASSPLSACDHYNCKSLPVTSTRIQVRGSGLRFANPAKMEVTVGGVSVHVVSIVPAEDAGMDLMTLDLPASLRGAGEVDLICRINGRVSNPVRIRVAGAKPVS